MERFGLIYSNGVACQPGTMTGPAAGGRVEENSMGIGRNVEVWIVGAFLVLGLVACLSGPSERAAPAPMANAAVEGEMALPIDPTQPMYTVYVVGKRPTAAEKRQMGKGSAG